MTRPSAYRSFCTRVTTLHRSQIRSSDHSSTQSRLAAVTRRYRAKGPRGHPRRRGPPIRSARPEPKIYPPLPSIPTLALLALQFNCTPCKRDAGARSRTFPATVWFLHASCRDYLADERIVHARRIRGCTGWTKKVREEEEDDDQAVEEERKAHTRAWFQ